MSDTNIGRVSTSTPAVGDFNVTEISKGNVQINGSNIEAVIYWTPPAGGADRYVVELYYQNGTTLLNPGLTNVTGNSIELAFPNYNTSKYRLKITTYRGGISSYIIIEDIEKLA